MKKKTVGIISLSLTAALVSGLSGCGAIDKVKEVSKGANQNKLTWYMFGDKPADHDKVLAEVNKIVEPELGMPLDLIYIDPASYAEKMKLKMGSHEPYDLAFTGYINTYETAADMGGLYDITDMLDNIQMKDGTTVSLRDVISEAQLQAATYKGRVYGIPNTQVASNPSCIQIRKAIADECDVDLEGLQDLAVNNTNTETSKKLMDYLTEQFEKIHAKRPDLNTVNAFNPATNNIYENLSSNCFIRKDGADDEVRLSYELPEVQYGIDTLNKWYESGYFRDDIMEEGNTIDSDDVEKTFAVILTTWKPGQEVYFNTKYDGEEPGYAFMAQPYMGRAQALSTMISVGAQAEHPEEAVKFIYMINTNKELFNKLCWGIEGEHFKFNDDKTATEIGEGYKNIAQFAWKYGNQFNSYVMEGQPLDVWEQTNKMNEESVKSPALGFVLDTTSITTQISNIANVSSEFNSRINCGTANRSEYWDEYVKKLEDAGIRKVRDEIQKQYTEYRSTLK